LLSAIPPLEEQKEETRGEYAADNADNGSELIRIRKLGLWKQKLRNTLSPFVLPFEDQVPLHSPTLRPEFNQ
jgi:hypothetical protein